MKHKTGTDTSETITHQSRGRRDYGASLQHSIQLSKAGHPSAARSLLRQNTAVEQEDNNELDATTRGGR